MGNRRKLCVEPGEELAPKRARNAGKRKAPRVEKFLPAACAFPGQIQTTRPPPQIHKFESSISGFGSFAGGFLCRGFGCWLFGLRLGDGVEVCLAFGQPHEELLA